MDTASILVIEDNYLNMKLFRSLLTLAGFTVLEAVDAETGIRLARQHLPDLILMDIQLPGLDGLEATRIMKNDPQLHAIPIVAVTSHAMRGDAEKTQQAGCAGYIAKPIETRTFVQTIRQYLDSSVSLT